MVLDGLDVAEGEIVGLLGANGAGGTTAVEILRGLRAADAGAVRVLGPDPAVDGVRLRAPVGSQQQDPALPDRLRVGEAVELFRLPGSPAPDGLLVAFGLADRRRTAFCALSGGQRQRPVLVLALLNRPRLVIPDELTQGLDPAARRPGGTSGTRCGRCGTPAAPCWGDRPRRPADGPGSTGRAGGTGRQQRRRRQHRSRREPWPGGDRRQARPRSAAPAGPGAVAGPGVAA